MLCADCQGAVHLCVISMSMVGKKHAERELFKRKPDPV